MNFKKFITIILCVVFFTANLSSCENVKENSSTENSKAIEKEGEQITALPETPEYQGTNFVIAVPDEKLVLFSTEEDSESIIRSAVEKRNNLIAQKYGITMEYKNISAVNASEELRTATAAGIQFADLLCLPGEAMVSLVSQGQLYNLLSSNVFDINAGYIGAQDAKNITVNNSLYMIYNSATQYYDDTWVIFYDKNIIAQTGLTDPAIIASSNEWTWEKFLEYSESAAKAVMEKGSPDLAKDVFGFGSYNNETNLPLAMWESCGIPILGDTYLKEVKITDDLESVNKTTDLLERVYLSKSRLSINEEDAEAAFKEGRLAFFIDKLNYASTLTKAIKSTQGGYNREWGLLPLPKLDINQTKYQSYIDSKAYALAIPANVIDNKKSVTILNSFCAASGNALKTANYDKYVNLFLQNNTSSVLLKTILDTGYFDAAALYGSRMEEISSSTTKLIISAITENGALERPIYDKSTTFTNFSKKMFK